MHHASGGLPFARGFCVPTWGQWFWWGECIIKMPPCHTIALKISIFFDSDDSDWEFIEDDETIDDSFVFLHQGRPLEDDESSEDLEWITANIKAHYSGKHPQHQPNDDMTTEQPIALMYCFSVPVSDARYRLRSIFKVKTYFRILKSSHWRPNWKTETERSKVMFFVILWKHVTGLGIEKLKLSAAKWSFLSDYGNM